MLVEYKTLTNKTPRQSNQNKTLYTFLKFDNINNKDETLLSEFLTIKCLHEKKITHIFAA